MLKYSYIIVYLYVRFCISTYVSRYYLSFSLRGILYFVTTSVLLRVMYVYIYIYIYDVCMYVRMNLTYVCMHACIVHTRRWKVRAYTCAHTYMHAYIHTHAYIYIYIHTYIYIYIYIFNVCMYVCMHACMYVYACMYACMYV